MRVVCPSCDAAYDVPESVVAARRRMRCARCAAEFAATDADQPAATFDLPQDPPPRPRAAPAPAAEGSANLALTPGDLRIDETERLVPFAGREKVTRLRIAAVLGAWVLSLALLVAAGWAFVAWRERVMHAWPASTRIYAALGYVQRP